MNACVKIKGSVLFELCERAKKGIYAKREKEVQEKILDCHKRFNEEVRKWNQSIFVRFFGMKPKEMFLSTDSVCKEMDLRFSKDKYDEWGEVRTTYLRKSFYGERSGWEYQINRLSILGKEFPDMDVEIETQTLSDICVEAEVK